MKPIEQLTFTDDYMFVFRIGRKVQNRMISRYTVFVVWKLYKCRFATQQTSVFEPRSAPSRLCTSSPNSAPVAPSICISSKHAPYVQLSGLTRQSFD